MNGRDWYRNIVTLLALPSQNAVSMNAVDVLELELELVLVLVLVLVFVLVFVFVFVLLTPLMSKRSTVRSSSSTVFVSPPVTWNTHDNHWKFKHTWLSMKIETHNIINENWNTQYHHWKLKHTRSSLKTETLLRLSSLHWSLYKCVKTEFKKKAF